MSSYRKAAGGAIVCAFVLGLCLLVLLRLSRDDSIRLVDIPPAMYGSFYALLLLVQILSFMLWRAYASAYGLRRSFSEAFIDTGLLALGKYLPGKIWGLLARGAIGTNGLRVDRRQVLISVSEQVAVLATGILVLLTLTLTTRLEFRGGAILLVGALVVMLGSTALVVVRRRVAPLRVDGTSVYDVASGSLVLVAGYALLWLASAAPLVVLVDQSLALSAPQLLSLTTAFIGAMIAGWLAFFAPGGIGIRESAFVALAPSFLSWEQGLFWITVHRSLSLAFDLVFGLVCLAFVLRRSRQGVSS